MSPTQLAFVSELLLLLLIMSAFTCVALLTFSHRAPFTDEVMDAELPINLAAGRGCVSYAHGTAEPGSEIGFPAPAYLYGLANWLRAFGPSRTAVLSFNCVLTALSATAVWAITRLIAPHSSVALRLFLPFYIVILPATKVVYGTNRYDSVGLFGCTLACLVLAAPRFILSIPLLAVAGLLVGTGGLHAAIAVIALAGPLAYILGRQYFAALALVVGGVCVGVGITLGIIFLDPDKASSFRSAVAIDVTTAPFAIKTLLLSCLRGGHPTILLGGNAFLLCALAILLCRSKVASTDLATKAAKIGLTAGIVTPFVLTAAGRYSFTYTWLAAIPMAVGAFGLAASSFTSQRLRIAAGLLLALAAIPGLPLSVATAAIDWSANDYRHLVAFVDSEVLPDDVSYGSYAFYYPLRENSRLAYFGMAVHALSSEQRQAVTLLLINEMDAKGTHFSPSTEFIISTIGGEWQKTAELTVPRSDFRLSLPPRPAEAYSYRLAAYRRVAAK